MQEFAHASREVCVVAGAFRLRDGGTSQGIHAVEARAEPDVGRAHRRGLGSRHHWGLLVLVL